MTTDSLAEDFRVDENDPQRIFHAGPEGVEVVNPLNFEPGPEPVVEDMTWQELWLKVEQIKGPLYIEEPVRRSPIVREGDDAGHSVRPKPKNYKGGDFSVLKHRLVRIREVRTLREAIKNERTEVGPDFLTSIRYRKNSMRLSERQSTKALMHWFGHQAHHKIVQKHIAAFVDEVGEPQVAAVYRNTWSGSFVGLAESFA